MQLLGAGVQWPPNFSSILFNQCDLVWFGYIGVVLFSMVWFCRYCLVKIPCVDFVLVLIR